MQSLFASLTDCLTLINYDDWLTFDSRLAELVSSGRAVSVPRTAVLHMPDEEWYADRPVAKFMFTSDLTTKSCPSGRRCRCHILTTPHRFGASDRLLGHFGRLTPTATEEDDVGNPMP